MSTAAMPWMKYQSQPASGGDAKPWEKYATPKTIDQPTAVSTDPSGRTPTGEPGVDDHRNALQRVFDNLANPDPRKEEWQNPARTGLDRFAQGVAENVTPLIAHPLKSIAGAATTLGHAFVDNPGNPLGIISDLAQPMIESGVRDYQENGPAKAIPHMLGQLVGGAATGELGGEAMKAVPKVGSAIRTAAIGDPNVAALKGLRVGPASAKSIPMVRSVEGARPYLQGVKSLEDAQSRVPLAKAEIWNPYQQTIDAIGDKPVQGPDGPTTVRDLENERLQISANLRTLKSGTPEGIQLAAQKGMNQADLLAREKAIQGALDPHLEAAGIDPKSIRATFGNVAQVGARMSGKSTLAEASQPYGFGKMAKIDLAHPLKNPQNIFEGARDLVAGRPWWSGKPTDINLREAFRNGGPKPDFRAPSSSMPKFEQPPRLLEANVPGNAGYGDIDRGGMAGIPHPGPIVTPVPLQRFQLPEITTPGEVQPMIKYAKPYIEPFDPHFKPVDLKEYRNMFKKKE
jgi:hypothetical protein